MTEIEKIQFISKQKTIINGKALKLLNDIENLTINIGVFGGFSAGKSSIIDAILEYKIIPTKVVPTTAHPIIIHNSKQSFLRINYKNGTSQEIKLTLIDENHAQKLLGNKNEIEAVNTYEIFYPVPLLGDSTVLIDTPGTNSAHFDDDRIASEIYNYSDIVIYVINAQQPLNANDAVILNKLKLKTESFFILLNKSDTIDETEQSLEDILDSVRNDIKNKVGLDNFFLYPVSAKMTLNNAIDNEMINSMKEFTDKLSFFINEKMETIKQNKINKLINDTFPDLELVYNEHYERKVNKNRKSLRRVIIFSVLLGFISFGIYAATKGMDWYFKYQLSKLSSGILSERESASNKIAGFGSKAVPELIRILTNENNWTQNINLTVSAIKTIAIIGPDAKDAVPALLKVINSDNMDIKIETLQALYCIKVFDESVIAEYIKAASNPNNLIKKKAIEFLYQVYTYSTIHQDKILKVFIRLLNEENNEYQIISMNIIRKIGNNSQAAIPSLIKLAGSRDRAIQLEAIDLLGIYSDLSVKAVPTLLPLLEDNDSSVRDSAYEALMQIENNSIRILEGLLQYSRYANEIRKTNIINLFIKKGSQGVPSLVKGIKSNHKDIKLFSISLLGDLGPQAKDALYDLEYLLNDPNPDVREETKRAMKMIDSSYNLNISSNKILQTNSSNEYMQYVQRWKVTDPKGLYLRERPSLSGKIILLIPYNGIVTILSINGPYETIDGIYQKWMKVRYNNKAGWSFSGYMKKVK